MDLSMLPLFFAQAQPAAPNPSSMYLLALRRWCSSLTLSSPQAAPSLHGLWALLGGLAALLVLAVLFQGPFVVLKQLFDPLAHARLIRAAAHRVWRGGRVVSIAIGFTVVSWTVSQAWVFTQEGRRLDLVMLTRSRSLSELAFEQGILAALTPLRDVAGLADNLPLLVVAALLVFRVSFDLPGWGSAPPDYLGAPPQAPARSGWPTLIWGSASLYALYRIVARLAGSTDLPLGNCLVIEALVIPILMIIADGSLLAWLVTELRNAGLDDRGDDRLDLRQAIALMPGSALACVLALPARYMATFVWLSSGYLPTSAGATALGGYFRWQLGWGLTDLQAVGLAGIGLAGAVAWSRGSISGAISGYGRLLTAEGGHLVAAAAMAATASGLASAAAYGVVMLLPVQSWVLAAADSYAHFATLPVGLWTLAAVIELAERSLPTASLARPTSRKTIQGTNPEAEWPIQYDAHPPVATPAS
jgi:hypothetical protein